MTMLPVPQMDNGCKPLTHGQVGFNVLWILLDSVANIVNVQTFVVRMAFVWMLSVCVHQAILVLIVVQRCIIYYHSIGMMMVRNYWSMLQVKLLKFIMINLMMEKENQDNPTGLIIIMLVLCNHYMMEKIRVQLESE